MGAFVGAPLALTEWMHINVSGVNVAIPKEQRGYAEYRLFTSIAPHGTRIRGADVFIRRDSASDRSFLCTVVVDLGALGRIKTQARAAHATAAIDRAADRTAWLVRRRAAQDRTRRSPAFSR